MWALMRSAIVSGGLALLLAGCGQQPIGSFARAQFIADGGQAHHDVRFTKGCTSLAQGEAPRLAAFLEALELRRGDDIVVSMGSTGSDRRDRERRQNLLRAIKPGPARVLLSARPGFARLDPRHNAALVQVIRHDQVRVDCKAGGYNRIDRSLRMPFPVLNCANPSNLAHMAAEKRDLTSPRQLGPARSEPAASAVRRQRAGEVRTVPLDSTGED
jgi:type IV pilus biogenesis protein CpaD/CtpE